MARQETIAPGERSRGLRSWLRQRTTERQVCSQPLKLLLFVSAEFLLFLTLSVAVRRSVVIGAPFWLSAPATASRILAWLLPLLRTVLLHLFGAVALEVPYALPRWHWSVLEAAIAAPRPETTGPDAFRDCWST